MITKHFFKILILFALMIALGLLLVFVFSNFDKEGYSSITNTAKIAK